MISAARALISLNQSRPSWDDYFMSVALLISRRSTSPKKKVGSVIVLKNRIISSGYNGVPTGMAHVSIQMNGKEINTIHSEQNAMADAAR